MTTQNNTQCTSQPVSIEILDVHLDYMRKDIQNVLREMTKMATTDDIRRLSDRMDKFVTNDRFDALERKVNEGKLSTSFGRAMKNIQTIAATIASVIAIGAAVWGAFHYIDKLSKLV